MIKIEELDEAEVYLEMIAECPTCGESVIVEYLEPLEGLDWSTCDKCNIDFKYKHPEA